MLSGGLTIDQLALKLSSCSGESGSYFVKFSPGRVSELLLIVSGVIGRDLSRSPDVFIASSATFGIDEARSIKEFNQARGWNDVKYIFAAAHNFTPEAQNALLKTMEEPGFRNHIFIVAHKFGSLLPTLRSRLIEVVLSAKKTFSSSTAKFLTSALPARLEMIREIVTKTDKDEVRAETNEFLRDLSIELERRFGENLAFAEDIEVLRDCDRFLLTPAVTPRQILEHVAGALPKYKS